MWSESVSSGYYILVVQIIYYIHTYTHTYIHTYILTHIQVIVCSSVGANLALFTHVRAHMTCLNLVAAGPVTWSVFHNRQSRIARYARQ